MGAPHYKPGESWRDRLPCGTNSKYTAGCRCDACREARADYAYFYRTGEKRVKGVRKRRVQGLSRTRPDDRSKRIALFSIAADIESAACRLQGLGDKARADWLFTIVVDLRTVAEYS